MTNGDKEELVSLSVVKSLMAVQENAFRSMIEVMFNGLREDIKEVKKDVVELQKSLEFSLKDVAEIEEKLSLVTKTVDKNCTSFEKQTMEVMRVENKVEYIENQSRRNNIKLIGLNESDDEVSWDDTEKIVVECFKNKLDFQETVEIERAHRIGVKRPPGATREDGSSYGPRPVVAKLKSWKQKEAFLKAARIKKPDGIYFHPDLAEKTLERRKSKIPDLIQARREGKNAYFIRDKLIISQKPFHSDRRSQRSQRQKSHEDDEETEVTFG